MTENKRIGDLLLLISGCLLLSLVPPSALAQEGMIVGTSFNYIYPFIYDSCNRNLLLPEEVTPLGLQMFSAEPRILDFNNYISRSGYMEGTELSVPANPIVGTVVASADLPVIMNYNLPAGPTTPADLAGANGYISVSVNVNSMGVSYTHTTTATGIFDFQESMQYVSGAAHL